MAYTVVLTAVVVWSTVTLLGRLPDGGPETGPKAPIFGDVTFLMLLCGALGGCLYNYRGIVKHGSGNTWMPSFALTYLLHPLSGALSGMIVFLLLLGGLMTLTVSAGDPTASEGWMTLRGRLPYMAAAMLAGFGTHKFTSKLSDIADSVFAVPDDGRPRRASRPSSPAHERRAGTTPIEDEAAPGDSAAISS